MIVEVITIMESWTENSGLNYGGRYGFITNGFNFLLLGSTKKDRYSSVFWNWSMGKINWSYQR